MSIAFKRGIYGRKKKRSLGESLRMLSVSFCPKHQNVFGIEAVDTPENYILGYLEIVFVGLGNNMLNIRSALNIKLMDNNNVMEPRGV
jgi:hypothetical protein